MAIQQDIVQLPYRISDAMSREQLILAVDRNLKEIERMLSILQQYMKQTGKLIIEDAKQVITHDEEGNAVIDPNKLADKMVGLNHALQIAEKAVGSLNLALDAVLPEHLSAAAIKAAQPQWATHALNKDYVVINNSPLNGYIAWQNVKITYKGEEYSVIDGNTNMRYIWWDYNYPTVMQTTDDFPELTDDDVLVFFNKFGAHLTVPGATVLDGGLIVPGTITADALAAACVLAKHIGAGEIIAVHIKAGEITTEHISADGLSFNVMHGGTATLGGYDNINGLLSILNEQGIEVVRADKNGITINAGSIGGNDVADLETQAGAQAKIDAVEVGGRNLIPNSHISEVFTLDPQTATFTRSSVAYLSDGTQVAANTPRFEQGKFGKAVLVEEGTVNRTDPNNPGINWHSDWSVEVIAPRTFKVTALKDNPGRSTYFVGLFSTAYSAAANESVTLSCEIVECSNPYIYVYCNGFGRIQAGDWGTLGNRVWRTITHSSSWSHQLGIDVGNANLQYIRQGDYIIVKDIQIEAKPYPTTFTDGTRAAETLTIPTAGVLNPQEGTIEFWWNPLAKTPGTSPSLISTGKWTSDKSQDWLALYWGSGWNNANEVRFGLVNGTTKQGYVEQAITLNPSPFTWYFIAFKWDFVNTQTAKLLIYKPDGSLLTKHVSLAGIPAPSFAGWDKFYVLQTWNNGPNRANSLIDDLRISNRARTDEEIAAAYASGQPLPVDQYTTYKMGFDDTLQPTGKHERLVNLEAGQKYTFSSQTSGNVQCSIYEPTLTHPGLSIPAADMPVQFIPDWTGEYKVAFSANESCSLKAKLEKGNKATDWTPAPEDVEAYAEHKAAEAQAAAEAVARAEAELAEIQAKAYADGIVDAEEQARIDQAAANLAEAKAHAETKAAEAEQAAKAYAETKLVEAQAAAQAYAEQKAAEAQAAAEAVARAEAELAQVNAEAYADGKVSAEEQARIDQAVANLAEAKAYAETKAGEAQAAAQVYAEQKAAEAQAAAEAVARAEAELAEAEAKAYADGVVSAEEQARIDQAAANLAEAKAHAEAKAAEAEQAAKAHSDAQLSDHDANQSPHSLPAYVRMEPTGFVVYDDQGNKRTHNGQYAPGEFGNWVDAGHYVLRDKGMDMSLMQLPNLIPDHSFECLKATGNIDTTYHDFAIATTSGNWFEWNKVGSPRLLSARQTGIIPEAVFGLQAVVTNSSNYVAIRVECKPNTTYYLSGFVARGYRNSSAGTPRLYISFRKDDDTQISTTSQTFTPNTGLFNWKRVGFSFTTPTNCTLLYIVPYSTDSNYIYWDALQLVEGNKPVRYEPEENLWRHMFGASGVSLQGHIVESGENANGRYVRFSDGTQICIILTRVTTDSTQNYVEFDVVFPASFLNTDYAVTHAWYGGFPGRAGAFTKHANARTTGSITGATYTSLSTNFTSVTRTIGTIVIGRWK